MQDPIPRSGRFAVAITMLAIGASALFAPASDLTSVGVAPEDVAGEAAASWLTGAVFVFLGALTLPGSFRPKAEPSPLRDAVAHE